MLNNTSWSARILRLLAVTLASAATAALLSPAASGADVGAAGAAGNAQSSGAGSGSTPTLLIHNVSGAPPASPLVEPAGAPTTSDTQRSVDAQPAATAAPSSAAMTAMSSRRLSEHLAALAQEYDDYVKAGRMGSSFHSSHRWIRTVNDAVVIDAVALGDTAALKKELEALGLIHGAVAGPLVGGLLPIRALRAAAALPNVGRIRESITRTHAGLVTSEGDTAMHSDLFRTNLGVNGAGTKVGIVSNSFDCLGKAGFAQNATNDALNDDLPAPYSPVSTTPGSTGTYLLQEGPCPTTSPAEAEDEGRAMAQIVHDIAPGAAIMFWSGDLGTANWITGITTMRGFGANVIVDDLGSPLEPWFQDGLLAQATDGLAPFATYVTAAGNDARNSYQASFVNSGASYTYTPSGTTTARTCALHNFASSGSAKTQQGIFVPAGETLEIVLQWDQPFGSLMNPAVLNPGSEFDLFLFDTLGNPVANVSGGAEDLTTPVANTVFDPSQYLVWKNAGANTEVFLSIGQCGGSAASGPLGGYVKYIVYSLGLNDSEFASKIVDFPTNSSTVVAQSNAASVITVGAADYSKTPAFGTDQPQIESFSSAGGTPILFDINGHPLTSSTSRTKPEVVGPDNVINTFFPPNLLPACVGSTTAANPCRFSGTSAAAPHIAGFAALLYSQNAAFSTDEIRQAITSGGLPMADTALPTAVAAASSGISSVASGGRHTCALTTLGSVQCWGSNSNGQLGNGTTVDSDAPVAVTGLTTSIVQLAAGDKHTCAIDVFGAAYCWGLNLYGQLGNGTGVDSATPVTPTGLTSGVTKITAGADHTCAIVNGTAECWGNSGDGEVGTGVTGVGYTVPQVVTFTTLSTPPTVTDIVGGGYFVCALDTVPTVWCWGQGTSGQLGNGALVSSAVPVSVSNVAAGVTSLAAGTFHACAVNSGGTGQCWGWNGWGELGVGSYVTPFDTPQNLADVTNFVAPIGKMTAGTYHTCFLETTASPAWCWGLNDDNQLGNGQGTVTLPLPISSGSLSAISAGASHTCGVTASGGAVCWGSNAFGQSGASPVVNNVVSGVGLAQAFTANRSNQTITFYLKPTIAPLGTGTVLVVASSGLPVTLASTTPTICTVSGDTVTGVANGTCTLTGNQFGDGSYNAAPQVTDTLTVTSTGTAQTITFGPAPSLTPGGTATVTATASSGLPVVFISQTPTVCTNPLVGSNNTITGVAAGTCTIAADQPGNAIYYFAPEVTQTIQVKANQTITFGPVPVLLTAGSTVTVTATASSGLPVTLSSSDTTVCTVTGTTVFGVASGTCTIAADQAGDATYNAAPQVTVSFPVKTNQSITFAVVSALTVGGSVTLSATASSGLPVTFSSLTTTICTVSGSTVTGVAPGTCTIAADQAGDSSWNPAPEVTQNVTVTAAGATPQTITFGAAPALTVGGTAPVSATASSGLPVTFSSLTTTICTVSGFTVTGVAAGTCTVAANQGGNATYAPAPQVTQNITVTAAAPTPQTITFGAAPTLTVGTSGTLSATASSGLPVTFSSTTAAICTVTGSTVTGVTAGSCVVAANQAGNATFAPAPQVTQTITVGPGSQTITFGTAPTLMVGTSGTLSATASSGLTVTFSSTTTAVCSVTGSAVTGVTAGSCVVAANQAGNGNYNAAPQVTQTITVGPGSQTITFGAAPTLTVGGTATLSATASSGLPVTFSSLTSTVCTVSGSTVSGVAAGTCTVTANQAGNANYNAAPQATQNITVTAAAPTPQTITFGAAPTLTVGTSGTLSATASSGLPVTFSSTTAAVCTVAGSTVTGVTAGACVVAANQAGNATYAPAPQVSQTITVGPGSQTITFGAAPTLTVGGTATLSATASSGLPVTFSSLTSTICTVSGSTVTGVAAGTCTVAANQVGNANYTAAPQVTENTTVTATALTPQTIAFGVAPVLSVGGTGTLLATASSGLPVTFSSLTTSVCTVARRTVTGVTAGTCTVAANQTGNATYAAAQQVTQSFPISAFTLTGLTPTSLNFGNELVGRSSASQTVTLENAGAAPLTVGTITITVNFRITSRSCGTTLGAGSSCEIGVAFAPTSVGAFTGALTAGTNGTVALSGTGIVPSAGISPTSFNFGSQLVGTMSAAQTFTYTNTGLVAITVASVTMGGISAASYRIVADLCTGATLAPQANCTIGAIFAPAAAGTLGATLRVHDAAGGAPSLSASLGGTGLAPNVRLGSTPYQFGAVTAPTSATFHLRNVGNASFLIGGIAMATGTQFVITGGTCAIGITVINGGSCSIIVTFTPNSTTSYSDTLSVSGSAVGTVAPTYTAMRAMAGS